MQKTINHEEIKKWIINHEGVAAIIDHKEAGSDTPGIRIDFPGNIDEQLLSENETKDISWDEFFKIFDTEGLAFEYEEEPQGNDPTMWYRFTRREE